MTTQSVIRQALLPDMTDDTRKSVKAVPSPSHSVSVPQKGIPVGKDYRVGADSFNVILYKRMRTKESKDRWETWGYYSTLGACLVGLVRQGIRDTELASVQAIQDKIAQLKHDILKMAAGR